MKLLKKLMCKCFGHKWGDYKLDREQSTSDFKMYESICERCETAVNTSVWIRDPEQSRIDVEEFLKSEKHQRTKEEEK